MTGQQLIYILILVLLILNAVYVLDTRKILLQVRDLLIELAAGPKPVSTAALIEFYITIGGQKQKVVHMFLKDSDNLPLSIAIKDLKNNDAKVDGVPAWSVTDPSLASLAVADDGMSAVLSPVGGLGAFKVQVHADADLGADIKDILGEMDVDIIAGDAATIAISAGAPVPQ